MKQTTLLLLVSSALLLIIGGALFLFFIYNVLWLGVSLVVLALGAWGLWRGMCRQCREQNADEATRPDGQ